MKLPLSVFKTLKIGSSPETKVSVTREGILLLLLSLFDPKHPQSLLVSLFSGSIFSQAVKG